MKLNLNDMVKVIIKPKGYEALRLEHEELFAKYPNIGPFVPPSSDADGFHHMQLWRVMEVFGPHIHMGCEVPIDTYLVVKIND